MPINTDGAAATVDAEGEDDEGDDTAAVPLLAPSVSVVSPAAGSKAGMASVCGALPSSGFTTVATVEGAIEASGGRVPVEGVASHKDMGARRPGHGMG
jgi:hypothetical protein